jgi:hypothetical protein
MTRGLWDRFATELQALEEAPEPLRSVLQKTMFRVGEPRFLLLNPGRKVPGQVSPASLLALSEHEWLLAMGPGETESSVVGAPFADTLLVELMVVLLQGRLQIDYATSDGPRSARLEFKAVSESLFQRAARLILNGIEGNQPAVGPPAPSTVWPGLPMRFQNALREFKPAAQTILALAQWPPVTGRRMRWYARELAPEAMLVLTERELFLISDERSWSWLRVGRPDKFGNVVTYVPLRRLKNWRLGSSGIAGRADLEIFARDSGKTVQVDFPLEVEGQIEWILHEATRQRRRLHSGLGEKNDSAAPSNSCQIEVTMAWPDSKPRSSYG